MHVTFGLDWPILDRFSLLPSIDSFTHLSVTDISSYGIDLQGKTSRGDKPAYAIKAFTTSTDLSKYSIPVKNEFHHRYNCLVASETRDNCSSPSTRW